MGPPKTLPPKVVSYRSIDFHPDADRFTKHLLGAATNFYYEIWIKVAHLLRPFGIGELDDALNRLEQDFSFYIGFIRGPYPDSVKDYVAALDGGKRSRVRETAEAFVIRGRDILLSCGALLDRARAILEKTDHPGPVLSSISAYRTPLERIMEDFQL